MEAQTAVEGRVFVVGAPRSGTTLVQSLLAAHSRTTSFTESHFFHIRFARASVPPWAIATKDPAPRVREFLAENDEPPGPAAEDLLADGRRWLRTRPMLALRTRPLARRLLAVLDELAARRGAAVWIEKTPRHLRSIPFLERLDPRLPMHFVHVVRRGLDVVASLHRASPNWERLYTVDECARRWNADLAFSLRRSASPNDHVVFYEELADQPKRALERLLRQLGLESEAGILERYGRAAEKVITGEEPWKSDVGRTIRRSQSSERSLTAAQRDLATARLRSGLYDAIWRRTRQGPPPPVHAG
jgi:hypothetical protein